MRKGGFHRAFEGSSKVGNIIPNLSGLNQDVDT